MKKLVLKIFLTSLVILGSVSILAVPGLAKTEFISIGTGGTGGRSIAGLCIAGGHRRSSRTG